MATLLEKLKIHVAASGAVLSHDDYQMEVRLMDKRLFASNGEHYLFFYFDDNYDLDNPSIYNREVNKVIRELLIQMKHGIEEELCDRPNCDECWCRAQGNDKQ